MLLFPIPDPTVTNSIERYLLSVQRTGRYATPASVEEAKARRLKLETELLEIGGKLSQLKAAVLIRLPSLQFAQIQRKRSRLVCAKQCRDQEVKWLKQWIQFKISTVEKKAGIIDSSNPIVLLDEASKLFQLLIEENVDFEPQELALIEAIKLRLAGH
ncbi:MAG TPA: hypothetical protein VHD69_02375 [Candidatus Paceibacterota bacterium]|nr:hypothetical protein [Candidatus Paceibacterota bacterium]